VDLLGYVNSRISALRIDILGQFIFSGYLPYIYNGKTNLVLAILEENFLTTKYGAKNIMQTVT